MRETEITVEVFDLREDLNRLLNDKGFLIEEKYILIDYYYSKHALEELKFFTYKDLIENSFLIRYVNDGQEKVQLCYKNKVVNSQGIVVSEEKVRCSLGDMESAKKIFNLAGLTCWCNIKQDITVYKKDNMKFLLQEVDGLGTFIEYEEHEGMQHLSEQQKIDVLMRELSTLGLKFGKDYSCKKVYLKFKKDNNLT